MPVCRTCLAGKPVTEFYQWSHSKALPEITYQPHCKCCVRAARKAEYSTAKCKARVAAYQTGEAYSAYQATYKKSPEGCYKDQKASAKRRGISFLLTFEQWWALWAPHWDKRGKRLHQYCMARKGDVGPYAIGNVEIKTNAENSAEQKALISAHKKPSGSAE